MTPGHARVGRIHDTQQQDDIRAILQRHHDLILAIAQHVSPAQPYMTPEQAADYLQVSKKHLMANLKDRIGYSKDKQVVRFHRTDLDAYMAKIKQHAVGTTATISQGASKSVRPHLSQNS